MIKNWIRDLFYLVIAGVVIWFLLPDRFKVNAPLLRHTPTPGELRERVTVPRGFSISIYASDLIGARMLRFTSTGDLLVSLPKRGTVLLLERDNDRDGESDGRRQLVGDLSGPHGIDLYKDWLYVAEAGSIKRIKFDQQSGRTDGPLESVVEGLPRGGNHWSKTLRFGPDGLMYVSVGSSCNACIESDPRRAALLRYAPDGSDETVLATGLRNAVGFDWEPVSESLYATDPGRDYLGDDFPPCELNLIEAGGFYGWPFANGNRVPDPDLGAGRRGEIAKSIPPSHNFAAHSTPLGLTFLRGEHLPSRYRDSALVALHGSWNRSEKQGYEVVSLHFADDGTIQEREFATGFELDGNVIGRPVDVTQGPDGAIFVSDDYAGLIYRIAYAGDDV